MTNHPTPCKPLQNKLDQATKRLQMENSKREKVWASLTTYLPEKRTDLMGTGYNMTVYGQNNPHATMN